MSLTLPGVDVLPPDGARQRALSQWFTPPEVAARLVLMAAPLIDRIARRGTTILEPSAGQGAIVRAIRAHSATAPIDAVELDPRYRPALERNPWTTVEIGDYLSRPSPQERYPLAIANPPYEGGLDGLFLAKLLDECDCIVALVRLATLAGSKRHARVWSHVEAHRDGWWLRSLAICAARPVFLAAGEESDGGKTDFVVVHLTRSEWPADQCALEWWT
jgi:predicted RNA methylase